MNSVNTIYDIEKTSKNYEEPTKAEKKIEIRFLASPVSFIPDIKDPSRFDVFVFYFLPFLIIIF